MRAFLWSNSEFDYNDKTLFQRCLTRRVIGCPSMENRVNSANGANGGSDDIEMAIDTVIIHTSDPVVSETMADQSVAADLDSQPLNDLGVSVMDQDVLERNVAAQV